MEILQRFLGTSVTKLTMAGYSREWKVWVDFVKEKCKGGRADPYLVGQEDRVKVLMICHLLADRKAAITAAIKKHFEAALLSTEWMKAGAISVARKACRRTLQENREYIKAGLGRARLPVWLALLTSLREKMWEGRGFGWEDIDSKMTYMFGF
jgi:hypothetical protein